MNEPVGTYPMPDHGWTCFHCGETFTTPGAARLHFGKTPDATPGCILKAVGVGAERGLLACLRRAEEDLAAARAEDTELTRSMVGQQMRHSAALRTSEEAGYERGLRDALPWLPPTPEAPHEFDDVLLAVHGVAKASEGFRDHGGDWWFSTGHRVPGNAVYAYAVMPDCPVIPAGPTVPASELLDGAHTVGGAAR